MRYYICLTFLSISIFMIIIFIRYIINTNREKDVLSNELYKLGDLETLYKIGEVNFYGHKERRRVPPFLYCEWLETKYNETKNEIYNDVKFLLLDRNEKIIQYGIGIGISFMIAFGIYYY